MSRSSARSCHIFALLALIVVGASATDAAAGGSSPSLDFPPSPQATILGGRAIFTVIASGTAPFEYQWRKDGVDLADGPGIEGATSDALILSAAGFDDAADYSVVVSNAFGDATSAEVALAVSLPQGGDLDFAFDPGSRINGVVSAMALQPDGRILIGGSFTTVNGAVRGRIARLMPDGSTDHSFGNGLTGLIGSPASIIVLPDSRALIGGTFTMVNGVSRNRIARLNADGSLDTTFLNGLSGVNNSIRSMVVQPDGRVLIVGDFTTVNGVGRTRIARLNTDGSLDTTFLNGLAGASSSVTSVAVQPDGRVLIGGFFTEVNGVIRNHIARLNIDGSLDTAFLNHSLGANDPTFAVALQPDGRALIGGDFTTIDGVGRNRIARLNPDGSLDTTFLNGLQVGADDSVFELAVQPDGRVLIGGNFTEFNAVSRSRIARLNADGSLDTTFLNGLAGVAGLPTWSMALQSDGRVLIGGDFATVNGVSRNRIARLNADGSLDGTFLNSPAGADDSIYAIAAQPDGRVLIGGAFATVNGFDRNHIARLDADGSFDETFQGNLHEWENYDIRSIVVQPDGRVLIGGQFAMADGEGPANLARLNTDGSLDTTFLDGMDGVDNTAWSIALQPDGRILIGGYFTAVNGVSRSRIARLNADGSLDTSFLNGMAGANNAVLAVVVQPDGRVLIGGLFTAVNGVSRSRIARLNADGSLDDTFLEGMDGANSGIQSIALQPDGRVLAGGGFSVVNGVSRTSIARLNPDGSVDATFLDGVVEVDDWIYSIAVQHDSRVLIAGSFAEVSGVSRKYFARLNTDGSLDTTFLDGMAGTENRPHEIVVLPDGRILIGGVFRTVNGSSRSYAARLHGSEPIAPGIATEPSNVVSYDACCAVFHAEASGTPLDYQWRKDGVDLEDGDGVSGAHTSTLTITGVTAADEGTYSVVVSNVLGSDTSNGATLTASALPQCQLGTCDPVLGCVVSAALDGASCIDENTCTANDTCQAGVCASGPFVDLDGDRVGDACDNCAVASNPDQSPALFPGTIRAETPESFGWTPAIAFVVARGSFATASDLIGFPGTVSWSESGDQLTDEELPAVGSALWYLLRPDCAAASWSSGGGGEVPGRDETLP